MTLPTEYAEPTSDFGQHAFLIHGEKKIGKTRLADQGGRTLFLQFDPPQTAYRRLEIYCKTYDIFKNALKLLEVEAKAGRLQKKYDRICIDRADIWFKKCQAWVCANMGIEYPGDESWGKGWDAVRKEFSNVVDRVLALPVGRWFICHSSWKEVENRQGKEIQKLAPDLTKMAEEVLNGKVDGWFAYDYIDNKRVMIVEGDERTGAGHRLHMESHPHFRTTDGDPVIEVSMGSSPEEGYANLVLAYQNKQKSARFILEEKAQAGKKPVKWGKK
jgi:hypothetical protein